MQHLRQDLKVSPSRLQMKKNKLGIGKLSSSCKFTIERFNYKVNLAFLSFVSDKKSDAVSCFETKEEADEMILEENKKRCEFFQHYKFDDGDKLGTVSGLLF